MILADSNVLLDVITADPKWGRWSLAALDEWARRGPILINPVIYVEIAPAYDTMEALDAAIEAVGLELREIPRAALFLASRAFVRYRRRDGARRGNWSSRPRHRPCRCRSRQIFAGSGMPKRFEAASSFCHVPVGRGIPFLARSS